MGNYYILLTMWSLRNKFINNQKGDDVLKGFRKILSLLLILALIIPGMAFANEPEDNINNPETEHIDLTNDERVELE